MVPCLGWVGKLEPEQVGVNQAENLQYLELAKTTVLDYRNLEPIATRTVDSYTDAGSPGGRPYPHCRDYRIQPTPQNYLQLQCRNLPGLPGHTGYHTVPRSQKTEPQPRQTGGPPTTSPRLHLWPVDSRPVTPPELVRFFAPGQTVRQEEPYGYLQPHGVQVQNQAGE